MLWKKSRRSDNVVQGGRGGGMRVGGGLGLGGIIVVMIVGLLFGKNPMELLQLLGGIALEGGGTAQQETTPAADNEQTDFVRAVLGSTEDVWSSVFRASGQQYPAPRLVLFSGGVQSACGAASSVIGPCYCPGVLLVYPVP